MALRIQANGQLAIKLIKLAISIVCHKKQELLFNIVSYLNLCFYFSV